VRGWDHGDYGRLVFEWAAPVDYSLTENAQTLTLNFSQPMTMSPKRALEHLGDYITGLATTADGKTVSLTLKQAFTLRHYREKNTVVVDFRRPSALPDVATPPAARPLPKVTVRLSRRKDGLTATFKWPGTLPAYRVEQGGTQQLTVHFSAAGQLDREGSGAKAPDLPEEFADLASTSGENTFTVTLKTRRAIATLNSRGGRDGAAVVEIQLAPPEATATAPENTRQAVPEDHTPPKGAAHPPIQSATIDSVSAAPTGDVALTPTVATGALTTTLGFPWLAETAAAAFQRAGAIWIVFDRPAQLDLSQLRSAAPEQIQTVEWLPNPKATILRLQAAPGLSPRLWRRGTAWQVDLRPQDVRAEVDITVQILPEALPTPRLVLALPGMGSTLEALDPAVGDRIWIVPVPGVNHGVTRTRSFPEVTLPATAQGIVIVPRTATLRVTPEAGTIVLTAASGLHLSPRPEDPASIDNLSPGRQGRLFDLRRWVQGGKDFHAQRQTLQIAISDAPKSRRNVRRMLLAEFLFAHGYATEARGVLVVAAADDPAVQQLPLFNGLMGAALILDRRTAEGLKFLQDDRLDRFPEVQLWRGAALAELGEAAAAQEALATAPGLPDDYAPFLAMTVAGLVAETWLAAPPAGDRLGRLLDDVGTRDLTRAQRSRLNYLAALRLRAEGKTVEARKLLEKLQNGDDHWSRTRAAFTLVQMGLAQGYMPPEQAIATLEKLRFAWRGDLFEFRILRTLGELLIEDKHYRYGMQVLAKALQRFPDVPEARQVDELMRSVFGRLYLEGGADAMPPLQALALFDEFRKLTPDDENGDQMIRKLADRLVAVDLLDRAGDLLEHQIRERLSGAARGRTGAHLALIKLLDRKPEDALKALDLSNVEEISDGLRDERRRLRARALAMQNKRDEALTLIEPDTSPSADRLRAEIYWDAENYPLLIATLERLVKVPADAAALTDRQAQGLLNMAMALSLNQDYQKLASLRGTYSAVMAKTPYQQMFDVITRTPDDTSIDNYAEVSAKFSEIRNFESFLEDYRQRLKNGQWGALGEEKPAAPPVSQAAP
jgi:hypothetical protein